MAGNGIHISFSKDRKEFLRRRKTVNLPHLREVGIHDMKKEILRFRGCLYAYPFIFQIGQRMNIAVCTHGHHLAAVHIRSCPLIVVLAVCHGITAPDAVNGSVCKVCILILPVNNLKLRFISQLFKSLFRKLYINSGILPVDI